MIATYDDCPDLTWQIAPSDSELISLSDIRLELEVHLTRVDGTPLQTEDCVSPVNNLLHGLFQSVSVELGGRSITDTSNLYFLRAYIENLIGFSTDAQKINWHQRALSFTTTTQHRTTEYLWPQSKEGQGQESPSTVAAPTKGPK